MSQSFPVQPVPFSSATSIEYYTQDLRALHVKSMDVKGRKRAVSVAVDGQEFKPTKRFFRSFFARYGINEQVFKYYDYDEVLERIASKIPDEQIRLCVARENEGGAMPRLFGVSGPSKNLLTYDNGINLLMTHSGVDVKLGEGVLQATHTPRSGEREFKIGPDLFNNRIMVELPIDGFGDPRMFLMLLRQICTNGAVGYARAFRSDIRLGQDSTHTLDRALGMFDNEEGFAALRDRFLSSQQSSASIREVLKLSETIGAAMGQNGSAKFSTRLRTVTGDLNAAYGIANLDGLSVKRQRLLPAECTVYDLINFATEIASHKANPMQATKLQGWLGTLLSEEYDLEGTARNGQQFQDIFL